MGTDKFLDEKFKTEYAEIQKKLKGLQKKGKQRPAVAPKMR